MAMNKQRRTSNINNIVSYDASGNVTLPAQLSIPGQLKLTGYLNTSSFTGTAVGYLAFDASGNILSASVPTVLNGTGIVRTVGTSISYISGTSAQFLKGDGSLDSNTYSLTSHIHDDRYFTETETNDQIAPALRAGINITGGGTISVDGAGNVKWDNRFIVISNGRSATSSVAGFFDITVPTAGTVITGVGGAGNKTVSAAGIPLAAWEALYYILPFGSSSPSVAANFRVVSYTADFTVPYNWLLICVRNGDGSVFKFTNGFTLGLGDSTAGYETNSNIANTLVSRDGSGNFSAGTITAALNGNAATATSATSATNATNASFATTQAIGDYSTAIANTTFVKNLFGSTTTSGTLDWNDVSNTQPGTSVTLLLGDATNGPGTAGIYYHPFNLEYSSKNGTGNVTQLAIAYGSPGNDIKMRGRYLGSWSTWVTFLNSGNYNAYSPTLTGTGASGTWGINITGTAASETLATVTGRGNTTTTSIGANNFWDVNVGSYNVNLGSASNEGRGVVAGYSGSSYSGIGYNVRHTTTGAVWVAPGSDTSSYLLFGNAGFTFYGAPAGTPGRTLNYSTLGSLDALGTFNAVNVTVSGYQTLHHANWNSYAPSLTGTGASGTWSINVTGDAGSVGGVVASRIVLGGSGNRRGVNEITDWNQNTFPDAAFLSSENSTTNAPTTDYTYGVQTSFHRSGPTYRTQFVTSLYGDNVYWLRQLRDSAGWSSWVNILHSGNYNAYSPTLTGGGASGTWSINVTGNAATATNLSTNRSNWVTNGTITAVVGQLAWRYYGNGHTIFDASASLSPDGTAVNNTNPDYLWTASYPTLMGWNGSNTYGVRVDRASLSDQVGINYSNDSNSTYQMLWGSGNYVYGTAGIYCNPSTDTIYTYAYRGNGNVGGTGEATWHPAGIYCGSTMWQYGEMYKSNTGINDVSQIYVNGWFRNNSTHTGLYNQITTQHWSSKDNGYWDASSTNSVSSIRFFTGGHLADLRGYVFANSSNELGFCDIAGAWIIRTVGTANTYLTGTFTASGDVIAFSDARVKENVETVQDAVGIVSKLRGVTYNRTDVEDKSRKVGVIAQEVLEVLPEVVNQGDDGMYGVSYGNIVGVLIEAIKEQQAKIDNLQEQINYLGENR